MDRKYCICSQNYVSKILQTFDTGPFKNYGIARKKCFNLSRLNPHEYFFPVEIPNDISKRTGDLSLFFSEGEVKLIEMLVKCTDQFKFYTDNHLEKGNADKATVNQKLKRKCIIDVLYEVTGVHFDNLKKMIKGE